MTDIFESSKNKLSRAKKNLMELEEGIQTFLNTKEYTLPPHEFDPNTGKYLWKVIFTKPFPTDLANIAADALGNLRAALDQAWRAIAIASGAIKPTGKAYFPIGDSAIEFEGMLDRGCKKFPDNILSLLRGFQPYKGGNDLIWTLNKVCATDKHDTTTPVIIEPGLVRNNLVAYTPGVTVPQLRWDSRENEIIYLTAPGEREPKVDIDIVITIHIAFDEIIGGDTTLAVLNNTVGEVEGILVGLEGEARRIGLIT